MKTKKMVIKNAFEEVGLPFDENIIYDNGWLKIKPTQYQSKYNLVDLLKLTSHVHSIRPKSLSGIENNNGWIKIDFNKLILPIDGTEVHFYHSFINENGNQNEYHKGVFNAALGFTSYYDSENYKINEITHYQPITNPKYPLY